MPPLDAPAAATATADVDVEPADQGTSRDLRLILCGDPCFAEGATALRALLRQGCLKDFIDRCGAGGQAVTVAPVGLASFAAGRLGLWLGRSLGEGCGLAFGLALRLVEAGAGLALLLAPGTMATLLLGAGTDSVVFVLSGGSRAGSSRVIDVGGDGRVP